jgi:hypothetical protein
MAGRCGARAKTSKVRIIIPALDGQNQPVVIEVSQTAGNDCIGADYGEFTCFGDVNLDGLIDVTDLLAVINAWGACDLDWITPWEIERRLVAFN